MHCPRCGQQQISEETKFCSRCGFPLGLVSEILAHGGFLPQLAELYKDRKFFTRRNGLIFSLFWFLILILMTALFGIMDAPGELIGITALIASMGALILVIGSFLILKSPPKNNQWLSPQPLSNAPEKNLFQNAPPTNQTALPPQQEQNYVSPARTWKSYDTGDLVPRSVTEGTTKLLEKDK